MPTISSSNIGLKDWKNGSPYNFSSFTAPTSTTKTIQVGNISNAYWGICIKFTLSTPATQITFNFVNGQYMTARNALLQYKFTTSEDTGFTGIYTSTGTSIRWGIITDSAKNPMTITKNLAAGTHYFYLWPEQSASNYPYDVGKFLYDTTNFSISYTEATSYTITYNANGHGTAPTKQTKYNGYNLKLRTFISNQTSTGYKVSYNANGGSSTPSAQTSEKTHSQTYWNTKSDGSGTNYSSGGIYSANAAATLYAIWKTTNGAITLSDAIKKNSTTNDYTITYNANTGDNAPSNQILTRTTPYTFNKWAAGSTSGTKYSAGASFTPSAATTMYATWTTGTTTGSITLASAITKSNTQENGYTVTFNANGGTCDITSLIATNTRSYTFSTWNTNASGTGTNYNAGASYSTSKNLDLYAIWTDKISNYGSINLPIPLRAGYEFIGWATTSSASTGVTGEYAPSKNLTLYAIWKPKGAVRIYHQGSYKMFQAWIYHNGTWRLTMPYIKNGSTWKLGG